ncbi:MAG TPA: alpha/beta hydrolase-fold protein [Thermoanaerobaculia bacterium]|nr:alpha/beta hydrolase-fold protein [Thermoanaerobaculia bacterium]
MIRRRARGGPSGDVPDRFAEPALKLHGEEGPAPLPPPPAARLAPELLATPRPGEVHVLGPVEVPGLAPRRLRVYLPRAWTPGERRALLLTFDGQNLFDDEPSHAGGWHLHQAVEKLGARGWPAPIVAGIDHGGEERIAELSPFPIGRREGKLDLLLDWVVEGLLPVLASSYRLAPSPAGTVVGGSSMGGLAALYAHFRHPEAFGGALALSPSLWVAEGALFTELAARATPAVSRIYLDCGAREGRGTAQPLVAELADQLARRGYGPDRLLWRCDPRGAHNEASWRRRLPRALRFLFR